jgi:hypothetical protein
MSDAEFSTWAYALAIAGLIFFPVAFMAVAYLAKTVLGIGHQGLTQRSKWHMYDPETGESRGIIYIDGMPGHDPTPPDEIYTYYQEQTAAAKCRS